MEVSIFYKEQIKEDIIFLANEKKQQGSDRNILNKWFQDSIKNYFLETYASPLLKNEIGEGFAKKVKQKIEKNISTKGVKFMNLLNQYKIELEKHEKKQKFLSLLVKIIISNQILEKKTALWVKLAKKKFIALMLIVFMEQNDNKISSFYDMWNKIFPTEAQIKKKLSKEDKLRLKTDNSSDKTFTTMSKNYFSNSDFQSQCSQNYSKKLKIAIKQENELLQQKPIKQKQFTLLSPSQPQQHPINQYKLMNRMNKNFIVKQEAYEQDIFYLDEPQQNYFNEVQYQSQLQISQLQQAPKTPILLAQQSHLNIDQYAHIHLPQNQQQFSSLTHINNNDYFTYNVNLLLPQNNYIYSQINY